MTTRVLMVYPRFTPNSFWGYERARALLGARYPAAPLGLITVAAMLPKDWEIRLVNRNTEELRAEDLAWPDMVMAGGMLAQQFDMLQVIELAHAAGKPIVIGGPDVTSSPQIYQSADFRVRGEAESVIDDFVAAWNSGERAGDFIAPKFQADVTKTPIPRYDLLKFRHYMYLGVQFSRGCPFTCEFCDIIELYGRAPRTKTPQQVLAEMDALYAAGYRGHLDFVDDNLIGNKKAVKLFLPHLIAWQKQHNYPYQLSTEASLNLSDDPDLLQMMREANFFVVFMGIESPDPDTLRQTQKKQNTRRGIPDSIHRIYGYGLSVIAGFIIGFDEEKDGVADAMVECIEEAAIPVGMVGLLYALPNTQLTRRLAAEGRLRAQPGVDLSGRAGDACLDGLNFETLRPRADVLADQAEVLTRIYDPAAFFGRVRRMLFALDRHKLGVHVGVRDALREIDRFVRIMWHVIIRRPDMRGHVVKLIIEIMLRRPHVIRDLMVAVVFFVDLGPLSRFVAAHRKTEIAELRSRTSPVVAPALAAARRA
ncbi:MAG: B12-binding domain-containing radical SAM protein [Rhodoblastus sp.]|nr:B12-binding domain-containing radical SAM protein [Rhodoblastus sp.]